MTGSWLSIAVPSPSPYLRRGAKSLTAARLHRRPLNLSYQSFRLFSVHRTTYAVYTLLCDLSSEACIDNKPFHRERALQAAFCWGCFHFMWISDALIEIAGSSRLLTYRISRIKN